VWLLLLDTALLLRSQLGLSDAFARIAVVVAAAALALPFLVGAARCSRSLRFLARLSVEVFAERFASTTAGAALLCPAAHIPSPQAGRKSAYAPPL
jgi:hypothetical protein